MKRDLITAISLFWPRLAARIDWCSPANLHPWGGPMNGQEGRQQLVRSMFRNLDFAVVVETGTYRGATTEFLSHLARCPIYTVEACPRYYEYARLRFPISDRVQLALDDSRRFLRRLATDVTVPKGTAFFYLDAHWNPELPLREEVALILGAWSDPLILIDDFQVPGDPGYAFDDFGPGQRLALEYLPIGDLPDCAVLCPALPSAQETGMRRGCALIARSWRCDGLTAAGWRAVRADARSRSVSQRCGHRTARPPG